MTIYKYLLLFIAINFLTGVVSGQNYGVKITDDKTSAGNLDQNIILDVESAGESPKGMLLPRMTYEQMLNITNPKDGLMVYVSDSKGEKVGVWFYNGYEEEWMRYQSMPSAPKYPEPVGAFIIYTGSLNNFYGYEDEQTPIPSPFAKGLGKAGTDMEGWAICNGLNGTPDLSGRFIVGGFRPSDNLSVTNSENIPDLQYDESIAIYHKTGNKGGQDSYKFTVDNMPSHEHKANSSAVQEDKVNITHAHTITNNALHYHEYDASTDRRHRKGGKKLSMKRIQTTLYASTNPSDDIKAELKPAGEVSVQLQFNVNSDGSFMTYAGTSDTKPVDNRPPHYVVVYIMKINKDIYSGSEPVPSQDFVNDINY